MQKRVNDTNRVKKHPWNGLVVDVIDVDTKKRESRIRIPGTSVSTWIQTRKLERI